MFTLFKQIIIFILFTTFDHYKCDQDGTLDALNPPVNQYNTGDNDVSLSPLPVNSKELRFAKSVKKSLNSLNYVTNPKWPVNDTHIGQITAVDIDPQGNVVIFHRGLHKWDSGTFNINGHYNHIERGPINISAILVLEPQTQQLVRHWGADLFYLPHGLTFDTKGFVWLTDVALQQVFKFKAEGSDKPTLTLGERFTPGNDQNHFCKPTSVAIDSRSGDFYVADGYCNARIVRFNSEGKFLNQWGQSDTTSRSPPPNFFYIPHKVVLAEDLNLICVADREHGRIQCFTPPEGKFEFQIAKDEFNGRLFSISYSSLGGGVLFAINGANFNPTLPVKAFLFNLTNRELLTSFGSFSIPHDIVSTSDLKSVYVAEIGPDWLWRFDKEVPIDSSNNPQGVTNNTKKSTTPLKESNAFSTKSGNFFLLKSPLIPSPFNSLSSTLVILILLILPLILVIFLALLITCRRDSPSSSYSPLQGIKGWVIGYRSTKSTLNLGRILNDPKRSGFNQLAMDDSDNEAELINGEIHSESEVEEFNVSSVHKI